MSTTVQLYAAFHPIRFRAAEALDAIAAAACFAVAAWAHITGRVET